MSRKLKIRRQSGRVIPPNKTPVQKEVLDNIVKNVNTFGKAAEAMAELMEEIEARVKNLSLAVTLHNSVLDVLIEKGVLTHEEVTKMLQSNANERAKKTDTIRPDGDTRDSESGSR